MLSEIPRFRRDVCRSLSSGQGRAFTSIELLVVIVVTAMLMTMVLPGLIRVREKSKIMGCLRNLQQMGQGCLLYGQDFNGNLSANSWIPSLASSVANYRDYTDRSGADDDLNWLYPNYMRTLDTFVCPATRNSIRNTPIANPSAPNGSYLADLADNAVNTATFGSSYEVFGVFSSYPTEPTGRKRTDKESLVHQTRTYSAKLGVRPGPSAYFLIMDADDTSAIPDASPGNPYNSWPDIGNNHGSPGTCANFCDGHAEFVPMKRYLQAWNLSQDSNSTGH